MRFAKVCISFIVVLALLATLMITSIAADDAATTTIYGVFDNTDSRTSGLSALIEGEKTATTEVVGGYTTWKLDGENIRFDIDDSLEIVSGETWNNAQRQRTFDVDISYYDRGFGGFYFQYDSYSGKKNVFIQCEDNECWRYARIRLYDAKFGNGLDGGADFKIITKDSSLMQYTEDHKTPNPVYLYWVKVYARDTWSSFDISESSGKPGNVFFEGDDIGFLMTYTNTDNFQYENMQATYSVYKPEYNDEYAMWNDPNAPDIKGVAYSKQTPLFQTVGTPSVNGKNATDYVWIDEPDFGVYVMKVDLVADYVGNTDDPSFKEKQKMTYIFDFSYSKKGETNFHFGINTHYDDYTSKGLLYTKEDLENQIDLVKNAGFGIIRTGLRWSDVKKSAVSDYSMPSTLKYAFKYMNEQGIMGMANLHAANGFGYGTPTEFHDLGDTEEACDAFGEYAGFVAEQLSPYTKYYTILNEYDFYARGKTGPWGDRYDAPSENSYFNILKAANTAIKSVQPDAWINMGEICQDPKWQFGIGSMEWKDKYTWDTRLYKLGAFDFADSVSYHRYNRQRGPENCATIGFPQYGRQQKDTYAPEKEVWVTEMGWPARPYLTPSNYYNVEGAKKKSDYYTDGAYDCTSYEYQAKYYPRAMAMYSDTNPVDKFMFYEFQDDRNDPFATEENFGIIRGLFYRTPWAAKPAYISTAAFSSIVGNVKKVDVLGDVLNRDDIWTDDESKYGKMIYKMTKTDDSEVYCIWRNENAPENTYTVNTNKPYAEVLDLYGNIIQVVEGGTVAVKTKPEMQYVRGVDKPTKTTGVKVSQGGNELEAMWYMESGSGISMRYTPDNEIKEGDKIMLIAGAYDADGMLLKVVVDNETYTGATMRLGFGISKEELSKCKKLEFFIMEGDTIKPIVESIPIYGFKDDENITLSKRGDLYTVSGTSEMLKNKYVSITVLNDGARRANVDSDTYPDYCLYQGQTKADADGYFEAHFTVDSDIVTGAAVNISADGFTTQKVIR